jgi:arabinogalactan endo-1,4-beta-galactosidase
MFILIGLVGCVALLGAQTTRLGKPVRSAVLAEAPRLAFRGVDASFVPQLESAGVVFRDANGAPRDPLAVFAEAGVNLVRLRVWHSPANGWCGTQQTLAMARRANARGMQVMLCIHYSDTWADPGQQHVPAAWQGQTLLQLRQSVQAYTCELVAAMDAQGTPPALVQIGNETTDGMLWPLGRISTNGFNAFATLFTAGADGVRQAMPSPRTPIIMCHIDRGGDNAGTRWFFDQMQSRSVAYDAIGLSYYPWWHGSLATMQSNLHDVANRYAKRVMIVETAYPFTLGWNDNENNFVGLPSQLQPGFSATAGGQAAFVAAVNNAVAAVPGGRGLGTCYWAPEYVANPALGSPWENLTAFDFSGRALPVLHTLGDQ